MPNQGGLAEPELDHRSVYFRAAQRARLHCGQAHLYASATSLSLGEVPGFRAGSKHEVIAFDVGAEGVLWGRRFFCHTDHGYPGGFAVDARGWV